MRIGIGRIASESHTFSPVPTDMQTLMVNGILRGPSVIQDLPAHERGSLPGFLDVVKYEELVGIISAHAPPAGPLTEEAMNTILEWFIEDLRNALPLDGLLLSLHGAFVGAVDPDVEGLVLKMAREIVGDDVVIGAAMDLHANITRRKIENADIIRGYHTHPHVDSRETGQKVAEMLVAALQKEINPVMSAVKIPMITPAETQISEEYPLRELMDVTRQQEEDERVLSSSVFSVQPWLDIPEMGWCTVVVTDGDWGLADRLARELADSAWDQREDYVRPCLTYLEALNRAFSTDVQPIVISDFADMMTGGGTGDSTWYLKEFLSRGPQEPCYLTIVDPQAVKKMAEAGEGAEITLKLGGKQDDIFSSPVEVTGQVLHVLPSSPERELPQRLGLTAVLRIKNIYVVVMERMGYGASPILYSGAGLDPTKAKILIAKSIVDFREGYKDIAKRFLLGEAPGLCPSNLRSLTWKNVPRPIFPLDDNVSWKSIEAPVIRSRGIYQKN